MKAKELLKPRFEVIADYPKSPFSVGEIVSGTVLSKIKCSDYPHLFRKLSWYELRKKEEMPMRLIAKASSFRKSQEIFDIEEWDMNNMVGWVNKQKNECCSVAIWSDETGYLPIDDSI